MISKRGLAAATAAGAAGVLLFSGSAFACSIGDFSAGAQARCDTSTGRPMAAITVTDKDASGTPATITVGAHLATGQPSEVFATVHIDHPTAAGVSRTVLVPWEPGAQWDVRVTAGPLYNELVPGYPTSADAPCTAATPAPSKAPVAAPVKTAAPGGTPSAAPTATAPAAAPAPSSSSPSAGKALAETGGGSGTGTLAAFAGVLIAIGGGAQFMLRRRAVAVRR